MSFWGDLAYLDNRGDLVFWWDLVFLGESGTSIDTMCKTSNDQTFN